MLVGDATFPPGPTAHAKPKIVTLPMRFGANCLPAEFTGRVDNAAENRQIISSRRCDSFTVECNLECKHVVASESHASPAYRSVLNIQ